jgi:uncharacterized protein (DUF433 family)
MKPVDELLKSYKSITLEEIQDWVNNGESDVLLFMKEKTGYGSIFTCVLCLNYYDDGCVDCIYDGNYGCMDKESTETYHAIYDATTPEDLYTAIQNRIEYIESLIKKS